MDNLYKLRIHDHYRNPRHAGLIANPSFCSTRKNPSCGDIIQMMGIVSKDGMLQKIGFNGQGCILSQAAASMLAEAMTHSPISTVMAMKLADMQQLVDIKLGPIRAQCIELPLQALQEGIASYNL